MGIRGPAPSFKITNTALDTLHPPDWLCPVAQRWWDKHASSLVGNHILNHQTADQFAVLCDLWARLMALNGTETNRTYLDTQKAFTTLAKQFRMSPAEKPNVKVDRHEAKGFFS
jgi:phage terminase small subunit